MSAPGERSERMGRVGSPAEWEAPLARGRALGLLSALDVEFARRLAALYGETRAAVVWALALACRQEASGHVCADLPRLAAEGLVPEGEGPVEGHDLLGAVGLGRAASPDPVADPVAEWIGLLATSPLIARSDALEVVETSEPRPLVLDPAGRLYLRRSFEDQRRLAELVGRRVEAPDLVAPASLAPETDVGDEAVRAALRTGWTRPLAIVTGGPGTGKTTLVVRLLGLLIEDALAKGQRPPSIRLLAPTGKAAAAMSASLARGRASSDWSEAVRAALPVAAETLHRALIRRRRRDALGRATQHALSEEIVVVDEASMVDLASMRQLFEACRPVGRLWLLGDPDQLASVDSGAVLAELCEAGAAPGHAPELARSIVTLRESHRYASGGAIGRLAEAIRLGDAETMLALLEDSAWPTIERHEVGSIEATRQRLVRGSLEAQRAILEATDPETKLAHMGDHRVLCAHRRGPLGVEALSECLDEALAIERRTSRRSGWWQGRQLLVTRNAPEQDLWNGDVGLVEETEVGLRALFPDGSGGVRRLSPGRLPAHESAMAMSIHKSQGSEFGCVDLVLGRYGSRLMTRELLYTGVTRARDRLRIHASEALLREALGRSVRRDSGLMAMLSGRREREEP